MFVSEASGCSLEMLSDSVFHFISFLLLLKCHLQVKCKQFLRNIQQNSWYEICPTWRQRQLIIWIIACIGCSVAFSALLNNFTTMWQHRMRKFCDSIVNWVGGSNESFISIKENTFGPISLQRRQLCQFLMSVHHLRTQTWAIASRNSLHLLPHTTDNH